MFAEVATGLNRHTVHLRSYLRLLIAFVVFVVAAGYLPFGYAAGAAFIFLLGGELLDEWARTKRMQQFALRLGFNYIGPAVPKSLSWQSASSLRYARSAKRVVAGEKAGRDFVVFDCRLGQGKTSRSHTVLAVRGQLENLGAARFGPDPVEQVGEWAVLRSSDHLLPVQEIEQMVSDIR